MAFVRVDEFLTLNTQYITKVKWKMNSETDELSASVFMTGIDSKNEVVAIRGEPAYKLWDMLHSGEDLPRSRDDDMPPLPPSLSRRLRRDW